VISLTRNQHTVFGIVQKYRSQQYWKIISVKTTSLSYNLGQIRLFSNINAIIGHRDTNCPLPTPVQCCFGHHPCPDKSCGLQNNIERGEEEGQIPMQ